MYFYDLHSFLFYTWFSNYNLTKNSVVFRPYIAYFICFSIGIILKYYLEGFSAF